MWNWGTGSNIEVNVEKKGGDHLPQSQKGDGAEFGERALKPNRKSLVGIVC